MTDLTDHWYRSDGYYFQRSDKLRKLSQESLLGACSNVKTVAVVIVAHVLSFIIIAAVPQSIMPSGIWTGNMLTCFDMVLEGGIKNLGMEDISQMLFSIAMKKCRKRKLFQVLQHFWSFSLLTKVTATQNATLKVEQSKIILLGSEGQKKMQRTKVKV